MVRIDFHRSFKKRFSRLPQKTQRQFDARLLLFRENRLHPLLNYHELSGALSGIYSINITGDIRAQLYWRAPDHVVFLNIGSHSELYG